MDPEILNGVADQNSHPKIEPEEAKTESHFLMHESEVPLYSLGFSNRQSPNLTIAIGSYLNSDKNSIYLLEVPANKSVIKCTKKIPQPYPSTMIKFHPQPHVS